MSIRPPGKPVSIRICALEKACTARTYHTKRHARHVLMTHWVQYFWQNLILKKANIKAVLYPPLGPLQNHTMQFRSRTLSPTALDCLRLFKPTMTCPNQKYGIQTLRHPPGFIQTQSCVEGRPAIGPSCNSSNSVVRLLIRSHALMQWWRWRREDTARMSFGTHNLMRRVYSASIPMT